MPTNISTTTPAAPPAGDAPMSAAVTYDVGIPTIHDSAAAMETLEYGLSTVADPTLRRHYLRIALALTSGILVPPGAPELLESFAILRAARMIPASRPDMLAPLGLYMGFGDLRRRDAMATALYEPTAKFILGLLGSPVPARRLRQAVERRLRKLEQVHQQRIEQRLLPDPLVVESGLAGEGVTQFTDADWPWLDAQLRASGRRTDQRTAEVIELYRRCGGSRARMGDSAYVFLQRQIHKPSRLNWLIRQCVGRG
jgi:hypothetical protein